MSKGQLHNVKLFFVGLFPKKQEDKETYKKIIRLTWPAFIELFLSSFFSTVDMVMVGRLGPEAMAGVGLTNQPFQLLISVFSAVNVGTTTLVAWNIGSGNTQRAKIVAKQAIMFNLLIGFAMGVFGYFASEGTIRFIGKDEIAIKYAISYMQILCIGVPFQAVNMSITAAFRACGQTRIPMVYNVGSNGLNVILNYLLIYGNFGAPAYGVDGAAIATTASRIVATAMAFSFVFLWKKSPLKISIFGNWRPNFKIIKEIFSIGVPAAGEQFVIQSGLILNTKMISSLGLLSYAAHQVAASVNGMAFSISQSFSVSNTALVGQAVGADNFELANRNTVFVRRLARVVTGFFAILFVVFARQICYLFTDSQEVIEIAVPIFYLMAFLQYIQSAQMSTAGALRGAGDTMYPLYATVFGIWTFRIGIAAIFIYVFKWGLTGAWFALILDQFARSIIIKRRFDSGKWRKMKAIKEMKAEKFKKRQETN